MQAIRVAAIIFLSVLFTISLVVMRDSACLFLLPCLALLAYDTAYPHALLLAHDCRQRGQ